MSLDTNNDILLNLENVAPTYEMYYNGHFDDEYANQTQIKNTHDSKTYYVFVKEYVRVAKNLQ